MDQQRSAIGIFGGAQRAFPALETHPRSGVTFFGVLSCLLYRSKNTGTVFFFKKKPENISFFFDCAIRNPELLNKNMSEKSLEEYPP